MYLKFVLLVSIVLNFNQLIFAQKLTKEDCKCKIQTSRRLLGGEVTKPNAYPFHVSLSKKSKSNESFCAGVILNHNHILTKARCVSERFLDIDNTIIRAGVHDLNSTEGEVYTIKKIFRDKRHTEDFYTIGDLSLIEIKETIKFTEKIQPACLGTSYEDYDDKKGSLTIIGWNPKSSENLFRPNTGVLKEALVDYERKLFDKKCYDHYICYRAVKRRHIMNVGDGGSGLIHTKNGISRVVGINIFTTHETTAGASRISFYKPELDKWTQNNYCSGNI